MTLRNAVRERTLELMEKSGLSQYRLSKISGVPQSTINSILNTKSDSCNLSAVFQLSQYLCGGIAEFFASDLFCQRNIESRYN